LRISVLAKFILIFSTGIILLGAGPAKYSEETVTGPTQGNHDLDCTVIRPWVNSPNPNQGPYPIIVWANGWGWNDNAGESTTAGYKPGLIEWALDGPYIVIAANQWSVQESDVLQCLQWIIDQNTEAGSEYEGMVNTDKIGLSGHSQGGGAIIKAGDGGGDDITITATVPMNPYGPAWVNPGNQDGPMMLLGGCLDATTPPDSYEAVWEAVQDNDHGGINAVLVDGTHNDDLTVKMQRITILDATRSLPSCGGIFT
jgi:dienelactone hydrolase